MSYALFLFYITFLIDFACYLGFLLYICTIFVPTLKSR